MLIPTKNERGSNLKESISDSLISMKNNNTNRNSSKLFSLSVAIDQTWNQLFRLY